MSELERIIQEKKESKDYITLKMGLQTERDCFEAIEATGAKLFELKKVIDNLLKDGSTAESEQVKKLVIAGEKLHQMQAQVVNDVCARFEVIHPELKYPSEELLQKKQLYWDWYRDQYKKYYNRPAPEVI